MRGNFKDPCDKTKSVVLQAQELVRPGFLLICVSADCKQLKLFLLSGYLMVPQALCRPLSPLPQVEFSVIWQYRSFHAEHNCGCHISLLICAHFHKPWKKLNDLTKQAMPLFKFGWTWPVGSEYIKQGEPARPDCIDLFSLWNQASKSSTMGAGWFPSAPSR